MTTEEQRKEINPVPAKTFPEIYASLNHLQQMELRDEIMYKLGVRRETVFYWAKGKSRPKYSGTRKIVARCVEKVVGVRVPQHILFDVKPYTV